MEKHENRAKSERSRICGNVTGNTRGMNQNEVNTDVRVFVQRIKSGKEGT